MKKKLLFAIIFIQILMLSGCIFNEEHLSLKEAEHFAEELIGEDVTHVMTNKKAGGKSIYYVFADEKEREFTINSLLARDSFEAFEYGPYKCHVSENYPAGMLKANESEIIEILMKYDLLQYTILGRFIKTNIYKGEGCVTPDIYLKVPAGTAEENLDILNRIAKAGTEIDALLALTYDTNYKEKVKERDIRYHDYDVNAEIHVTFDISEYSCDIALCEFSVSDDTRLTEEQILRELCGMLEKLELPEIE